jgi:5-methylcytosine-specific restriction endonuclease McrA
MTPQAKRKYHTDWARKKYAENPEPFLKRNAAWTRRNKAKRLAYWKARNAKPEIRKRTKKVRVCDLPPQQAAELRAKKNARWHKRRAQLRAVTINPRSIQLFITGTRKKKIVNCYYCEKPTPGKSVHFDHIIPLSKGGAHSVENLCASCPSCNLRKLNKPIQEWMRLGQQLLSL